MKTNRKKIFYLIFLTISAIIITSTFFSIFFVNNKEAIRANSNKKYENDYKYLVKEDNGKIKVFDNKSKESIKTLEKEVEYLPEYDQNMLQEGIYAYDINDLNKILEDYDD